MKKFLGIFIILNLLSGVFGASGIMNNEGKIHVLQTEWFDIIYGDEASDSAVVMFNNADQIYYDLAEMYGWSEPPCRMPVVLTTQVEVDNAYFSSGYYNHIVLYVTSPIPDLANQEDSLLWTFRHELTHAFTYNMKSEFLKKIDGIFSDALSLAPLTVTPGMAEGATLTSESYEGNGRLNDEFSKQLVKQAKIENQFPKFSDVQGSRDISPRGCFYFFNGAFHEYLQNKYGLDKYANFWYNCVNSKATIKSAFNDVYDLDIRDEWNKFADEYKVLPLPANPVSSGIVKDFFNPKESDYSDINEQGSLFENLSVSEKGITYVDSYTHTLFYVSKDSLGQDKIKPKKLMKFNVLESASQSVDGKYLVTTAYDYTENNYRYRTRIYNTQTNNCFKLSQHGLKDGIVVQDDNRLFLITHKFKGEEEALRITELNVNEKGNVTGEKENSEKIVKFVRNQHPKNLIPLSDGKFAYILQDKLDFYIQIMNINGEFESSYKAVDREVLPCFLMNSLSADISNQNELYFSWVCKDSMPRLGKLDTTTGEFTLFEQDISGGIHYPVVYKNELIYVGKFFEMNRLLKNDVEFRVNKKYAAEIFNPLENVPESDSKVTKTAEITEKSEDFTNQQVLALAKDYKPLDFMKRGYFIPAGMFTSQSFYGETNNEYPLSIGATFMTSNPWDSLTVALSGGYGYLTNSFGFGINLQGQTDTPLFSWTAKALTEIDFKGWKSGTIQLASSTNKFFGDNSNFYFAPSGTAYFGRLNATASEVKEADERLENDFNLQNLIGMYEGNSNTQYFYAQTGLDIGYSNVKKVEVNRYGKSGFKAGILPSYTYCYNVTDRLKETSLADISLYGVFYVPKLLPSICKFGTVTNLPAKFVFSAFSADKVYGSYLDLPTESEDYATPKLAMLGAEVILFGAEIQKSLKSIPFFYFYDYNISAIGSVGFDYLSHKDSGMGILHIADMAKEIIAGQNLPIVTAGLKAEIGFNVLNIGSGARDSFKNYFYVNPLVVSDLNKRLLPTFDVNVGIGINF